MKVSDFDFHLPPQLIAQYPSPRRGDSRLMVVDCQSGKITHTHFSLLPQFLQAGDLLVLNNTMVFPARLQGHKEGKRGRIEVLLTKRLTQNRWEALVRPGRKLHPADRIIFGDGELQATIVERGERGKRVLQFDYQGDFFQLLERLGTPPLPPYIKRAPTAEDRLRYQTIYAEERGAIAAPTAGLHFTPQMLNSLQKQRVEQTTITLHIGVGTFQPIEAEKVEEHKMEEEYYKISTQAAAILNRALEEGRRIIAVGTTTTRSLESASSTTKERIPSGEGWTDLFIYPGYQFKLVKALLTNFHLPRSSPLMLVCAFAGKELIMEAYRQAIAVGYRFYSYGDCMLIL